VTVDFTPGATWRVAVNNLPRRIDLFAPLCENVTLSKKRKEHTVLHCHQRLTKPRPQVTCTENVAKYIHVIFEILKWTERQTFIHKHTCDVRSKLGKCAISFTKTLTRHATNATVGETTGCHLLQGRQLCFFGHARGRTGLQTGSSPSH